MIGELLAHPEFSEVAARVRSPRAAHYRTIAPPPDRVQAPARAFLLPGGGASPARPLDVRLIVPGAGGRRRGLAGRFGAALGG